MSGSPCGGSVRRLRRTRTTRSMSRRSAASATGSSRAGTWAPPRPPSVAIPSRRSSPAMPDQSGAFNADHRSDDGLVFVDVGLADTGPAIGAAEPAANSWIRVNLPFRTRLLIGLIAASLLPLAVFGAVLFLLGGSVSDDTMGRILLLVLGLAAMVAVGLAYLLAADLTAPLRAIAAAVERTSSGDLS